MTYQKVRRSEWSQRPVRATRTSDARCDVHTAITASAVATVCCDEFERDARRVLPIMAGDLLVRADQLASASTSVDR
jgi:hypothetical protein